MRHTADQEVKYERRIRKSSIFLGASLGFGIGAFAAWFLAVWLGGDVGGKLGVTGLLFACIAVITVIVGAALLDD